MVALVAVCLVEAVLVALAVRLSTARAFDRFLKEEGMTRYVADVEAHVRRTGTVDGFETPARAPRPPQRAPRGGPRGGHPGGERDARRGEPGAGPPSRRAERTPGGPREGALRRGPRYGLVDLEGRVVVPFGDWRRGEIVPPDALRDGLAVVVDGRRVATAIARDRVGVGGAFPRSSPEARFLRASTQALLGATALGIALALGLGAWLTTRTVRPLRALTAAAGHLAAGALDTRVAVTSTDEVGQVADAFNAMSARLAEAHRLREQMTANVSHDLRTPLTTVLGTLEAIRSGTLPATPARIAAAHDEALRLGRLVDDLHTLALADVAELPLRVEAIRPEEVLAHVAQAFEAEAVAAGVALSLAAAPTPAVCADRDRLVQVLGNLVANAIRHTPPGGRVTLGAHREGETVALSVADTGEGIPADVLPTVFERSVRADASRAGGGAGLGLSIVRSLAVAMGGTVHARSVPRSGTTMTLRLPVADPRDGG